jgi:fatty acid desaturase
VADLLASFETGFERPSLDNPMLFSRYADEIAMRLGHEFPAHAGYRIQVKKKEEDPRKREWQVEVQRGWFSGARVMIKPIMRTPHRARVKVAWHSRLLGAMEKGFAVISVVPLIILFLAAALKTRLGFALIVTAVIGIAWGIAGAVVMLIVARLFAMIFGDEFNSQTRVALADKIQQYPLPQSTPGKS